MRILVVDDDPGVRRVLEEGLESYGLAVDTAGDGGAIAKARETSYDVVLVDMHLADDLDGLSIIKAITEFDRKVRFVVMTGKKRLDIASKLVQSLKGNQVASFLFKPFDLEEIYIAVHRAVGRPAMATRTGVAASAEVG
jgi:DNA-binding NtrC family response regulator